MAYNYRGDSAYPVQPPSHPVLNYQHRFSAYTNPASFGDPIRIPTPSGPLVDSLYTQTHPSDYGAMFNASMRRASGVSDYFGAMGVPVPQGAFKDTSERYKAPFYPRELQRAGVNVPQIPFGNGIRSNYDGSNYFGGGSLYGGGVVGPYDSPYGAGPSDNYEQLHHPLHSQRFFIPGTGGVYRDRSVATDPTTSRIPFFGSADAYSPFPVVDTPWEKMGILTLAHGSGGESSGGGPILNLYRRPIAPLQDLWDYSVQDKDGFVIPIHHRGYLENGDVVHHIPGKPGTWKVHNFVNNKWIWK